MKTNKKGNASDEASNKNKPSQTRDTAWPESPSYANEKHSRKDQHRSQKNDVDGKREKLSPNEEL